MNQQTYRKSFMVGAVAIGVIAGVAVGFFTAHRMMGTGDIWRPRLDRRMASGDPGRAVKG